MNMIFQKLVRVIGFSVVLLYISVWDGRGLFAEASFSLTDQTSAMTSAIEQCPTDLSSLRPKMEQAVRFIKSASFRSTMLISLQASIPDAIAQADGLARQKTFLKHEIVG